MRSLLLLLLLPAVAGSCGVTTPPVACTLIGCDSGLIVELSARPAVPYRVEVEVPGSATRNVFDCPDPTRCSGTIVFRDFTPEVARVHVTTSAGTRAHDAQLRYEEHRPNGERCPPLCRNARVRVALPEATPASG